jgi:hypothetical protein
MQLTMGDAMIDIMWVLLAIALIKGILDNT